MVIGINPVMGMLPQIYGGGIVGGGLGGTAALGMANPLLMGAGTLLQGYMQARAAQAEAEAARVQWEEQNFQARWQNQIQNRNIAKANAMQWMNNKKIEEAANKERAEAEFYLRYNYNNETGQLSRQVKQANDQLLDNIYRRGLDPKSGSGRALFQMALDQSQDVFTNQAISFENALVSAGRQQDERLAQRNFNYNSHIPFMGGTYQGPSGSDVFNASMASGLVQAGLTGYTAANENSYNAAIIGNLNA